MQYFESNTYIGVVMMGATEREFSGNKRRLEFSKCTSLYPRLDLSVHNGTIFNHGVPGSRHSPHRLPEKQQRKSEPTTILARTVAILARREMERGLQWRLTDFA